MDIKTILYYIYMAHKKANTNHVFICGGAVRDKIMERIDQISDLDITTGDASIHVLADEFVKAITGKYHVFAKKMTDGHTSVFMDDFKVDFSSNFTIPNIDQILLKEYKIHNPPPIQRELFSRDFTCNALLMSLDLKTVYDPTKRGVRDIKAKMLKTCLDVDTTLRNSPNRIIRVFELAAKLNFEVDPEILNWITNNKDVLHKCEDSYITKNLGKALRYNADKTDLLLTKTKLWNDIPISQEMYPLYKKRVLHGT